MHMGEVNRPNSEPHKAHSGSDSDELNRQALHAGEAVWKDREAAGLRHRLRWGFKIEVFIPFF